MAMRKMDGDSGWEYEVALHAEALFGKEREEDKG